MIWLVLIGPCLAVAGIALTDWVFGMPSLSFVGLANFADLFGDRVFWVSLRNTVLYVALLVPLSVGLGLGAALLINGAAFGQRAYAESGGVLGAEVFVNDDDGKAEFHGCSWCASWSRRG